MRKWVVGCAVAAALGLGASAALAQMAAKGSMASHSSMSAMAPHSAMGSMASSHMASSHMASSAGHSRETKMDVMMVHNCRAMPHRKMIKDAECRDYLRHHPDWMKRRH